MFVDIVYDEFNGSICPFCGALIKAVQKDSEVSYNDADVHGYSFTSVCPRCGLLYWVITNINYRTLDKIISQRVFVDDYNDHLNERFQNVPKESDWYEDGISF